MNETLAAQKLDLENQIKGITNKEKELNERIVNLVKEVTDERAALSESQNETEEVRKLLENSNKMNIELQTEKTRIAS